MKNIILFLSLLVSSSIFSQVSVVVPNDNDFSPYNGNIQTKNVYYAKGNDLNKNGIYLDDNEITLFRGKNKLTNTNLNFIVDNYSNPSELKILNSNFRIKLKEKDEFDFESYYIPFLSYGCDSVVIYKTDYGFKVEFEYVGLCIESINFVFDIKNNNNNYIASKEWFDGLTSNEKSKLGDDLTNNQILNTWIECTFLGVILNEDFISNEKFSFKYTNTQHYTNNQDYLNDINIGDK